MLLPSLVALSCTLTWVKSPNGYPYNYEEEKQDVTVGQSLITLNTSNTAILVDTSVPFVRLDKVTGSSDTAPPWTSAYSSLFDNSVSMTLLYYDNLLLPWELGWIELKCDVSEGAETWTEFPKIRTRNRVKYTNEFGVWRTSPWE